MLWESIGRKVEAALLANVWGSGSNAPGVKTCTIVGKSARSQTGMSTKLNAADNDRQGEVGTLIQQWVGEWL